MIHATRSRFPSYSLCFVQTSVTPLWSCLGLTVPPYWYTDKITPVIHAADCVSSSENWRVTGLVQTEHLWLVCPLRCSWLDSSFESCTSLTVLLSKTSPVMDSFQGWAASVGSPSTRPWILLQQLFLPILPPEGKAMSSAGSRDLRVLAE